jgi:D-ribose pyranose/furanose isomerase RbsD
MANRTAHFLGGAAFLLMLVGLSPNVSWSQPPEGASSRDWQLGLAQKLPFLGHRNWIVIADSAYPAQASEGIDTIYIGGDQANAVRRILQSVDAARHVRGIVYVDQELKHVSDKDAPGIDQYREQLNKLLKDRPVETMPHEDIIEKLDEAAEKFRVLIFKTDLTLPYTSVFIQLDCGYWSSEAEQRLRKQMEAAK